MAPNFAQQNNLGGLDEVVANQRIRATTSYPNVQGVLYMGGTGIVTSTATGSAGTFTATAGMLGGGIIIFNATGTGAAMTLDTAANIQTYMNANSAGITTGDFLQCLLINPSASQTFTVAAGANGTGDTNQTTITLPVNTSKFLNIKMTATGASPTYTVYC